jgi:hypothetical protein
MPVKHVCERDIPTRHNMQVAGFQSDEPLCSSNHRKKLRRIALRTSLMTDVRSYACFFVVRPAPLVEDQLLLLEAAPTLLRFGNGGDELCSATPFDQVPGRLARCVELPVLAGVLVRRIEMGRSKKKKGFDTARILPNDG